MSKKRFITSSLIIAILISVFAIIPLEANAADYTSGSWGYSLTGGEATITEYNANSSSVSIPSSLNGYPVTRISNNVFENSTMTQLTIPKSIEFISYDAFSGCKYLNTIYFNAKNCEIDGGSTFRDAGKFSNSLIVIFGNGVKSVPGHIFDDNNAHVTNAKLSNSIEKIGSYAFNGCGDLSTVTWSNSIDRIEAGAFYNCTKLTSITIPKTADFISYDAFNNCKKVNTIKFNAKNCDVDGGSSFRNVGKQASSLTVTFGSGVKKIPSHIFDGSNDKEYSYVTKVNIPKSVYEIGAYAFNKCYDLKTVKWGSGIKTVQAGAFNDCTKLTSVIIPKKTTFISYDAFYNCQKLKTIKFNAKNCEVDGGTVFRNAGKSSRTLKVEFGKSVKVIPSHIFDGSNDKEYTYVKKVIVSKSVKKVASYAFAQCYSLKSIKFKSKKTSIDDYAFDNCRKKTKFICYKKSKPAKFAKKHKFKISYIK